MIHEVPSTQNSKLLQNRPLKDLQRIGTNVFNVNAVRQGFPTHPGVVHRPSDNFIDELISFQVVAGQEEGIIHGKTAHHMIADQVLIEEDGVVFIQDKMPIGRVLGDQGIRSHIVKAAIPVGDSPAPLAGCVCISNIKGHIYFTLAIIVCKAERDYAFPVAEPGVGPDGSFGYIGCGRFC